ncbi:hypothetical protein SAMD00019534_001540 [Acytostelium subglobosum LB1]|uniref:hypothetical protein n=1 Tax=Acytostelium subglobosum LB1 TaxID=1410327 RepID=UPI000644D526|nr:hypothetical protein SAMD00019534_001540 [Acytostelium subglobosum LB1]GAM16979.1 hypothetical protein SAMD00019534_001540 [Acytostelium subglobosum LB1]|eukprot:XP_012759041.1 hypothetical protein SAMD00019534_001540 [Acytostelium subglobosum LB1]
MSCLDPFGIYNKNSFNLTCQYKGYATLGQACETTASCSTKALVCQAGTCQLPPSTKCTFDDDCSIDEWCQDNFQSTAACVPRVGVNGACQPYKDNNQCQLGLVCSYVDATRTNRTCIPIASKGEGQQCWDTYSMDFDGVIPDYECDLSKGLVCINDTCQKPIAFERVNVNCSGSDVCPTGSLQCICQTTNSTEGTCAYTNNYNSGCGNTIKDLVSCLVKNKCQTVTGNYDFTKHMFLQTLWGHCL